MEAQPLSWSGPQGRFELRRKEGELLVNGQPAELGQRAFDLLLGLVDRRGTLVSKHEILDLVWPGLVVEENNIAAQVSALRKILGPKAIATIPGRGYRFTAYPDDDGDAAPVALQVAAPAPGTGNLPPAAPPLIGRDAALRALVQQIEQQALVTVVGAGGIGKTSLALAAAVAARGRWRDGVWWVDLAPLADPQQLAQTIAQALQVALPGGGDGADQRLVALLRPQSTLLVLDNCEHLVGAVSRLVAAIRNGAPQVHILATSQELLGLGHEQVVRPDPLSVPTAGAAVDVQSHGAVALFALRARAADPRFALAPDNAAAVGEICRRLDGLPLAIELAAARVRLLGVQGLRERLDERFKLLTGGARAALGRHQTLRATIEWSHALLTPDEQAVLRRLGVFVDGFALGLAQQVCADDGRDEWAVLDALGTLVDKSLVSVDAGEPPRYRLLETTRAYALEQLAEQGEATRTLQRHAHAVCDLFLRADEERFGDHGSLDMVSMLKRLTPELDNWRAALDWAAGDGNDHATAIALAGSGAEALKRNGLAQELRDRLLALRPLVENAGHPLHAAMFWAQLSGSGDNGRLPHDVVLDAASRGLELYRSVNSRRRLYRALARAAWARKDAKDFEAAEALLAEAAALERAGDPGWLRGVLLNTLGDLRFHQQRYEEMAVLHDEQAALQGAPGEEPLLAIARSNHAIALAMLGRHEESLQVGRSAPLGDWLQGLAAFLYSTEMFSLVRLERFDEAWQTLREALPFWRRAALFLHNAALPVATLFAVRGHHAEAARLHAAVLARLEWWGLQKLLPQQQLLEDRMLRAFDEAGLARAERDGWGREGAAIDEAQAPAICEAVLQLEGQRLPAA